MLELCLAHPLNVLRRREAHRIEANVANHTLKVRRRLLPRDGPGLGHHLDALRDALRHASEAEGGSVHGEHFCRLSARGSVPPRYKEVIRRTNGPLVSVTPPAGAQVSGLQRSLAASDAMFPQRCPLGSSEKRFFRHLRQIAWTVPFLCSAEIHARVLASLTA